MMVQFFRKAVLVGAVILSITKVFAGTDVSGGGDGYSAEFIDAAKTVLSASAGRSHVAGANALTVADMENAIQTTQVETTADALRDSLGFERDALNIPAKKLIRVNRQRWSVLGARQRQVLVIHEYLGILQIDDTAYKVSAPVVATAQTPVKNCYGGGELVNLACFVTKSKGTSPGIQFQVSVFNLAYGMECDYRGNHLESYIVSDFFGAGVSIAKNIGYSGGDDFGSWEFANIYGQIGADEETPHELPRMGNIKTVIGMTGYPEQIRPIFSRSYFALKGRDANNVIRGTIKPKKKVDAGFRGVYATGETFDADLECSFVTDHGQIRNKMFNAIGGVERMIRSER